MFKEVATTFRQIVTELAVRKDRIMAITGIVLHSHPVRLTSRKESLVPFGTGV
jgi:hypothetical protein